MADFLQLPNLVHIRPGAVKYFYARLRLLGAVAGYSVLCTVRDRELEHGGQLQYEYSLQVTNREYMTYIFYVHDCDRRSVRIL